MSSKPETHDGPMAPSSSDSEAMARGGSAAAAASLQDLAKAYQSMAQKNAERLNASVKLLIATKNATEFIDMQQKLLREGVDAAIADSSTLAKLTTAVFTGAFASVQQQNQALQSQTTV